MLINRVARYAVPIVLLVSLIGLPACGGGGGGGGSGPSNSSAPSTPAGVAAVPGSREVEITWNAVSGASSYVVYWSTSPTVIPATASTVATTDTTFTHQGLINGTSYYYSVSARNGAGESAPSAVTMATPDYGLSWQLVLQGDPSTGQGLLGVDYAGSKYFALGDRLLTSEDGRVWTAQTLPEANLSLWSVAWSGTLYVAVGAAPYPPPSIFYGTGIFTSPDGVNWTRRAIGESPVLQSVVWNGTRFVATGGTIMTSEDGITWSVLPLYPAPEKIIWTGDRFVGFNLNIFFSSMDGINWSSQTLSPSLKIYGVAWSGTHYVMVGEEVWGTMLTSSDGQNWDQSFWIDGAATQIRGGIRWTGSRFIAAGTFIEHLGFGASKDAILVSTDGISWTVVVLDTFGPLTGIAANGDDGYVAVGYTGSILFSQ